MEKLLIKVSLKNRGVESAILLEKIQRFCLSLVKKKKTLIDCLLLQEYEGICKTI